MSRVARCWSVATAPPRDARVAARGFDPVALARLESAAWVGYYRREWFRVLAASVGLVRSGFALSWPKTLWGAWLVLRANQLWAPYPVNDPEGARRLMTSFYQGVDFRPGEGLYRLTRVCESCSRHVQLAGD